MSGDVKLTPYGYVEGWSDSDLRGYACNVTSEESDSTNLRWDDLPGTEYRELPAVRVTLNQIVAWNMAYFRKAAGLTQEELGKLLQGWTQRPWGKAGVSAAERAWDGKRPRQFDADLILGLARAMDVPIAAFYLPPDNDGVTCRYVIDPPYPPTGVPDVSITMHDLLSYALSDPAEDDSEAHKRYRERFVSTLETHYPGLLPSDYFDEMATEEQIKARVSKLRKQYDALRGIMGDIEGTFEVLHRRLDEIREARPPRRIEGPEDSE